jgi:hypothetical protein
LQILKVAIVIAGRIVLDSPMVTPPGDRGAPVGGPAPKLGRHRWGQPSPLRATIGADVRVRSFARPRRSAGQRESYLLGRHSVLSASRCGNAQRHSSPGRTGFRVRRPATIDFVRHQGHQGRSPSVSSCAQAIASSRDGRDASSRGSNLLAANNSSFLRIWHSTPYTSSWSHSSNRQRS